MYGKGFMQNNSDKSLSLDSSATNSPNYTKKGRRGSNVSKS